MVTNNYHEERLGNRKRYLDEKKALETKHKRAVERITEKIAYLKNSIDTILDNENEILDSIEKRNEGLDTLKKVMDPYSDFYDDINPIASVMPYFSSEKLKYVRKKTENTVIEKIFKIDRPLRNYLENLILGVNELSRIILHPISSVDIKFRDSLRESLIGIQEIANIGDYSKFGEIINKLKDIKNNFIDTAKKYQKAVESNKISLRERMQYFVRLNSELLEKECNRINEESAKKRGEYFNSLEGIVLAYSTYELELENTKDEDYAIFLLDKVDDRL